jgi:glycosyltransferase involved in cell wall biosynthesis
MYSNKKIGVVVPAYNEEKFIAKVINGVPKFVDKIYVVNDASTDETLALALGEAKNNDRVIVINHERNGGVGAAILTGHIRGLQDDMDVLAVMAGDGQMDPAILHDVIAPIIAGDADYVKGNRLSSRKTREEMPKWRLLGNSILTILTRVASGYTNITDPQDGYTAISASSLRKLDLSKIERGFAFENDILVKLNAIGARAIDIDHPAIYRGQRSKINYSKFIISTSWVLFKDYFWRIWVKYLKRSAHNA